MTETEKQVVLQSTSEPCFDFTIDGAYRLKKTVIISPITIEEYGRKKFKVTYGCSRGSFCKDLECKYGRLSKDNEEETPAGVEAFSSQLDR